MEGGQALRAHWYLYLKNLIKNSFKCQIMSRFSENIISVFWSSNAELEAFLIRFGARQLFQRIVIRFHALLQLQAQKNTFQIKILMCNWLLMCSQQQALVRVVVLRILLWEVSSIYGILTSFNTCKLIQCSTIFHLWFPCKFLIPTYTTRFSEARTTDTGSVRELTFLMNFISLHWLNIKAVTKWCTF